MEPKIAVVLPLSQWTAFVDYCAELPQQPDVFYDAWGEIDYQVSEQLRAKVARKD